MHIFFLTLTLLLSSFLPSLSQAQENNKQARDLVQKVQDRLRANTSIATYHMHIETENWQRDIRLKTWEDRKQHRFFIHILSPRKDKNTTWLKDGANLWMYLPKLERDIRIPPSMMLSNWMGSDFTNDDLVKMDSVVKDYTHKITADKGDVFTVVSVPKPNAPVVWGKIIRHISHDGQPISEDYYDEHGQHIRRLSFDQVKSMGGREIPSRWIMQATKTAHKRTIMVLESMIFNQPLDAHIFSRSHLRHPKR